jgi:KaiC/GvpD/RAD55 family RecA-like ATPase
MSDAEREAENPRCDFCRLSCPIDPIETERDGTTYRFCSTVCRDALVGADHASTEYRGYRRFRTGVAGIDRNLPEGVLRNSLVLLTGQAGTRDAAVHAELVWRTLRRGEPAVILTFQEPPVSVVETFLTMEWNVIPYLSRGDLHVVDAFTYRLDDPERRRDRMNEWNRFLESVVRDATTTVRDASDTRELHNKLDTCLDAREMVDTGVVLVDSLTELGTLVQPVRAYDFVKDLRADVCKGRFVPVFAGATYAGDGDAFPHDLDYTADGVVDMELNGETVEDTLIKRLRVRKMSGVLAVPEWTAYEYTARTGMVAFDPEEEIEKSRARRAENKSENENENENEGEGEGEGERERQNETNDGGENRGEPEDRTTGTDEDTDATTDTGDPARADDGASDDGDGDDDGEEGVTTEET